MKRDFFQTYNHCEALTCNTYLMVKVINAKDTHKKILQTASENSCVIFKKEKIRLG